MAGAILVGALPTIGWNLRDLLVRERAVARVIAPDEIGGAPGPVILPPPWAARVDRIGLRFTTADGREVTVARAALPVTLRDLVPGTEVPIRYHPANPETDHSFKTTSDHWWEVVTTLLGSWLWLSWCVRVARGAPPSGLRAIWPPLPFGR